MYGCTVDRANFLRKTTSGLISGSVTADEHYLERGHRLTTARFPSKRNARKVRNASDCVWMETGLTPVSKSVLNNLFGGGEGGHTVRVDPPLSNSFFKFCTSFLDVSLCGRRRPIKRRM